MKKISVVLAYTALAFSLSACGSDETSSEPSPTSETTNSTSAAAPSGPVEVEIGETITLVQDANGSREVNLTGDPNYDASRDRDGDGVLCE